MQSIIALAGVVGFAAAAVAPAYGAVSTEAAAATIPVYAAQSSQAAATVVYSAPAYVASSAVVSTKEQAVTVPAYAASTAAFACNPAHQYPAGQTCTEVNGSLTLITAATAPAYVVSSEEAKATAPVYYTSYAKVTETISTSAYVTVCPSPTAPATLVYNTKTYVVTEATTLTVTACANGCTVVKTVPVVSTAEQAKTVIPAPPAYTSAVVIAPKPSSPVVPAVSTEEAKVTVPVAYTSAVVVAPKPTTTLLAYKSQNATGAYPTAPAKYTGAATKVGAASFAMVAGLIAFL